MPLTGIWLQLINIYLKIIIIRLKTEEMGPGLNGTALNFSTFNTHVFPLLWGKVEWSHPLAV